MNVLTGVPALLVSMPLRSMLLSSMPKRSDYRLLIPLALACVAVCLPALAAPPTRPTTRPNQPPAAPPDAPVAAPAQSQPAEPRTVIPTPRTEQWWIDRHNRSLQLKLVDRMDMIFVGDSITQGWEQTGAKAWDKHYARRHAFNLGFSGDRTQHVLWRLRHNEVEGLEPKVAVVMIGTNNSNGNDNTAEEIAAGMKAVVASLRERLPDTKVLLLAIFPRGEQPNPQRDKNAKASELASTVADGKMVHYLDIGPKFLNADGTLSKDVMPDFLHLSEKGYQIWAEAIEDKVAELMGETTAPSAPKPSVP